MAGAYRGYNVWRSGNAYFICDRCSQRHRRSEMLVEWTNLRVDAKCLDPRPPQMEPPDVYPEGLPFYDARPPADQSDRLQDDTSLQSVTGGMAIQDGLYYPNAQHQQPGALSPLPLIENPTPQGPSVLADDITFLTGPVSTPPPDSLGNNPPDNPPMPNP